MRKPRACPATQIATGFSRECAFSGCFVCCRMPPKDEVALIEAFPEQERGHSRGDACIGGLGTQPRASRTQAASLSIPHPVRQQACTYSSAVHSRLPCAVHSASASASVAARGLRQVLGKFVAGPRPGAHTERQAASPTLPWPQQRTAPRWSEPVLVLAQTSSSERLKQPWYRAGDRLASISKYTCTSFM